MNIVQHIAGDTASVVDW